MTKRALRRLIGVLAGAVVVWIVASSVLSRTDEPIAATGAITEFFAGIDLSSVTAVRLEGPERTIELLPEGDRWTVNGHPSDSLMVARLFGSFADSLAGDLAGTNPANHDRMGVSADSAVALEIDIPGETRTLLLGKAGARAARVYGRLPGQDAVYLLEADLRAPAVRRLEDWRKKTMVATDTSRVTRVEIERDGEAYTIIRGDSAWSFEGGGEVDASTVRSVLSELARLTASGFLEESDSVAVLEAGGSNVAYAETGEILARVTIGSGESDRWARVPDDSSVFRLPGFRVDRITPKLKAMQPQS